MGWFTAFRSEGWPTWYEEQRTAVAADLVFVAILFTFSVLAAAALVVIIGIRGKGRWATFFWALFCLQLGAILLLGITGHEWQVSSVDTTCDYSILNNQQIRGQLGVKIGLKSVNVTLRGEVTTSHGLASVDYNERFYWDAVDQMGEEYEKARIRGLPLPILNVAEYFSADSGGLRWTRCFRQAGHFVYISLWSAFAAYLVSNILICLVVARGAMLFIVTGLLMLLGVALYHFMQPTHPFMVHLDDGKFIRLSYGVTLYLVLGSGLLTVIVGVAVWLANQRWPLKMATFFLIDSSFLEEELEAELSGLQDNDEIFKNRRYSKGADNEAFTMDTINETSTKKNVRNSPSIKNSPPVQNSHANNHDHDYKKSEPQKENDGSLIEKEPTSDSQSDSTENNELPTESTDIPVVKNSGVKVNVVAL